MYFALAGRIHTFNATLVQTKRKGRQLESLQLLILILESQGFMVLHGMHLIFLHKQTLPLFHSQSHFLLPREMMGNALGLGYIISLSPESDYFMQVSIMQSVK
jgi:hypothetical protein